MSAFYITVACAFGAEAGIQYYTGFFIEKSLSLDNIFVIAMIFSFFAVPRELQHRVLFWGVLGVLILRGLMIGLRALYFALSAILARFHYLKYALAMVLVFIGGKIVWTQVFGKPEAWLTLAVTGALLAGGMAYSLWKTRSSAAASTVSS